MTRNVLKNSGINYVEVPNEAAFYGPKIDVQVWSVIGREFTIATNQVDFAQPRRFNLVYKDRDNTEKTPLCIHRAPLGTHERFIGFLIEHYAGNFPLWLAPEQVRILPIGEEPPLLDYARSIQTELRANQVRCELDASSDHMKAKIANAEQMKVHTMLVIGNRDMEANAVSLRVHGQGNLGQAARRSHRRSSSGNQRAARITPVKTETCSPWITARRQLRSSAWLMLGCVLIGLATLRAATPEPDAKPKSREENAIDTLLNEPAPLPDWRAYLKRTRTMPAISSVPPPADAPQEEVVAYWRRAPKEAKADIETQKRLLKACEENPEELFRLLPRFSEESTEVYDRLKALAERLAAEKSDRTASAAELVNAWLMNHERHGREDLIARTFPNAKTPDLVEPQTALTKLAQSDRNPPRNFYLRKPETLTSINALRRFAVSCNSSEKS